MTKKERRREQRLIATLPVVLESEDRYIFRTLSRNIAASGVQVMMAASLEVDEMVTITYTCPEHTGRLCEARGRIVRVEPNTGEGATEWPHLVALELDSPDPNLLKLLGSDDPPQKP